ncbi:MAG: hypothetical protein MUC97_03155 [Bernardetiaceae bacterium]|jgi:hypothetical protein|nr:hypothetical protein [Bernardetiaceae bacterium]
MRKLRSFTAYLLLLALVNVGVFAPAAVRAGSVAGQSQVQPDDTDLVLEFVLEHLLRVPDRFPGEETTQKLAEPVVTGKISAYRYSLGQLAPPHVSSRPVWPWYKVSALAPSQVTYPSAGPVPLAHLGLGRVIHRFSVF